MRYPAIGIAVLFSAGILTADYFSLPFIPLAITAGVLCIVTAVIKKKSNQTAVPLFLLGLLFFVCGGLRLASEAPPILVLPDSGIGVELQGIIETIELPDGNSIRARVTGTARDSATGQEFAGTYLLLLRFGNQGSVERFITTAGSGSSIAAIGYFVRAEGTPNPGARDFSSYMRRKQIMGTVQCQEPSAVRVISKRSKNIPNMLYDARRAIYLTINRLHSPSAAALLNGLVIGSRSDLPDEITKDFLRAGITHILAISGSNVAFFLLAVLFFTGRLPLTARYICIVPLLFLFAMLTGSTASVYRAVVMAAVFYTAKTVSRNTNGMNTLAVSALIILSVNPNQLFDAGFLLSYSAVAGILAINPVVEEWLGGSMPQKPWLRNSVLLLITSISAQLGTLPFVLYYFQQFSIAGLLVNMAAIPLSGFLLGNGLITLLFSTFAPVAAATTAASSELLSSILLRIAHIAGGSNYSVLPFPAMSFAYCTLLFCSITVFMLFARRFSSTAGRLLLLLFTAASIGGTLYVARTDAYQPEEGMHFLQARNGIAAYLNSNGQNVLLNSGKNSASYSTGQRDVLPFLRYAGVTTIDVMLIPSPTARHIAAALPVLRTIRVKRIICPTDKRSIAYAFLKNACRRRGVALTAPGVTPITAGRFTITTLATDTGSATPFMDALVKDAGITFLFTPRPDYVARAIKRGDRTYERGAVAVLERSNRSGKIKAGVLRALNPRLIIAENYMTVSDDSVTARITKNRATKPLPFINLKRTGYVRFFTRNNTLLFAPNTGVL